MRMRAWRKAPAGRRRYRRAGREIGRRPASLATASADGQPHPAGRPDSCTCPTNTSRSRTTGNRQYIAPELAENDRASCSDRLRDAHAHQDWAARIVAIRARRHLMPPRCRAWQRALVFTVATWDNCPKHIPQRSRPPTSAPRSPCETRASRSSRRAEHASVCESTQWRGSLPDASHQAAAADSFEREPPDHVNLGALARRCRPRATRRRSPPSSRP
jgi:hypothetical protein